MKTWMKVLAVTYTSGSGHDVGSRHLAPRRGRPRAHSGTVSVLPLPRCPRGADVGLGVSFLLFGFAPLKRALGGSSWRTWARPSRSAGSWSPGGPTTCTSIPALICRDSPSSTAFT